MDYINIEFYMERDTMSKEQKQLMIMERREGMKSYDCSDEIISDQEENIQQPPLERGPIGVNIIHLTKDFDGLNIENDFRAILNQRTSIRKYGKETITLEELSYLLWMTQGVRRVIGKERKATLRTVPSAGARHPFETYLFINGVDGLPQGLYHYISLEHKLEFIRSMEDQVDRLTEAFCGQTFFANAPICFVWTCVPYRTEWRYTVEAQKYALIDIGHVCQNLYLSSESIGCGTCAIGAYEQSLADGLLGLNSDPSYDNENEFVIYAASVGKKSAE